MQESILILDFGSQYTQLIARRVRELNVYCEIHPWDHVPTDLQGIKGVILSGSPFSVRDSSSPRPDLTGLKGVVPVLAVCYGAQLLAQTNGGEVAPSKIREYGRANLQYIDLTNDLLKGMSTGCQVWMSHGDTILNIPTEFEVVASTSDVKVAGYQIRNEKTWGIQFHPEVYHSTEGMVLLENFVKKISGCSGTWTAGSFIDNTVAYLQETIGKEKVVLGLSGGVDSDRKSTRLNSSHT